MEKLDEFKGIPLTAQNPKHSAEIRTQAANIDNSHEYLILIFARINYCDHQGV